MVRRWHSLVLTNKCTELALLYFDALEVLWRPADVRCVVQLLEHLRADKCNCLPLYCKPTAHLKSLGAHAATPSAATITSSTSAPSSMARASPQNLLLRESHPSTTHESSPCAPWNFYRTRAAFKPERPEPGLGPFPPLPPNHPP